MPNTNTHQIEDYIESTFPLADDTSKRITRARYYDLTGAGLDLGTPGTRSIIDAYTQSIDDLKTAHDTKLNQLSDMAFANERRN